MHLLTTTIMKFFSFPKNIILFSQNKWLATDGISRVGSAYT